MAELYPSDTELAALSNTSDGEQEVLFIPTGESPYHISFYKMQYRLLDVARRAGDLRVYKDGDLTFGVRAGRFCDGATARSYAGSTGNVLTNNQTNYIYLTADGTLTVNTTGFPVAGTTPHIPLTTITTAAGDYDPDSNLTDYRARSLYQPVSALTPAEMNEAHDFFSATDITGAQAETLTDGSNAEALHTHLTTDAAILVQRGATPAASGTALLAAYAAACALTPGGSALAATNRAAVLIPPGPYTLDTSSGHGLTLDTDFVDLIALAPRDPAATWIGRSGDTAYATVKQTADDVRLSGFTIHAFGTTDGCHGFLLDATDNSDSEYRDMDFRHDDPLAGVAVADHAPMYADSDLNGTWVRCRGDLASWRQAASSDVGATMIDCEGGDYCFGGDEANSTISGTFRRCIVGDKGFGGCSQFGCEITADAIFEDCIAGDCSYAMGMACAGSFYRCRGDERCFGGYGSATNYPTFSGYAEDCVAGFHSFGAGHASAKNTGTMVRCRVVDLTVAMHLEGASLRDCELNIDPTDATNADCLVLEDGNSKLLANTILVKQGGTGIPINDDGAARNVVAAQCRMNNASNDADGIGANVTNLIGTPNNIIDDDMTL